MTSIPRREREGSTSRLYPTKFSARYYHLTSLRLQFEKLIALFLHDRRNLTLVDYGCGTKPYLPLFDPYVSSYIGVDFPENPHADSHLTQDGTTQLPTDYADVVLSTQVLEHVCDPMNYLQECYRVLKVNGLLMLSTHGYWVYHPDPVDYWRWTSSGLRKVVEDIGFELRYFDGVMGLSATALQLFQDALMPRIPNSFRWLFTSVMQTIISIVDKCDSPSSRQRDACVFIVVAAKVHT